MIDRVTYVWLSACLPQQRTGCLSRDELEPEPDPLDEQQAASSGEGNEDGVGGVALSSEDDEPPEDITKKHKKRLAPTPTRPRRATCGRRQ
jgi:hypothetical protein